VHWCSPEFGGVWYTSRQLKAAIWWVDGVPRAPGLKAGPNSHSWVRDLHWRSPESGGVWNTSRRLKTVIWWADGVPRGCEAGHKGTPYTLNPIPCTLNSQP